MGMIAYIPTANGSQTPIKNANAPMQNQSLVNPLLGFRKIVGWGVAALVLIGLGATSLWWLAYAIEFTAILSLALNSKVSDALTGLTNFTKVIG